MNHPVPVIIFALGLSLFAVGCLKKKPQTESRVAIKPGSLFREPIGYELAIYYLPRPARDPEAVLKELLAGEFKDWHRVPELRRDEKELTLATRLIENVKDSYVAPPPDALNRFGHGISKEQVAALQESQAVFAVDFTYGRAHVWDGLLSACRLIDKLARTTGGLIWDEETREVYSPEAWNVARIASWTTDVPDISKHTVIHAYKTDPFIRAITLGMAKFGLPDLVVDKFSWELNRNVGILINLFGQAMAEGAAVEKAGTFTLDLKKIRCAEVRDPQIQTLKPHASGLAELSLYEGVWEEGDPKNRLIEIGFDRSAGPDLHARQEKLLGGFFGWTDSVAKVGASKALLEASEKARSRIPKLRSDFGAGLQPGERILVKIPFTGEGNRREYMWIEVVSWDGPKIKGLLRSEPYYVVGLHAGQMVDVQEDQIYDYIRRFPGGAEEGNETGKVIEAQGAELETR